MFSILRFKQGCLHFHSDSIAWASLVLWQELILSALEGAIITRQQGRWCWKEIAQHNFSPPSPNVSLSRMMWISFTPIAPFISVLRRLRGGRKLAMKTQRRDYAGENIAYLCPCLSRRLSLVVWIQWSLDSREERRANISSSHLIFRSAGLWWGCTLVQYLTYSQGRVKTVDTRCATCRTEVSFPLEEWTWRVY